MAHDISISHSSNPANYSKILICDLLQASRLKWDARDLSILLMVHHEANDLFAGEVVHSIVDPKGAWNALTT